jgi:glycosyltransferase involved in cell wall biosynthesis
MLKLNDALIFNTHSSYDIASAVYPEIAQSDKTYILPVAINDLPKNNSIALQGRPILPPLKVAVLGNFCFHKGADLIVGAIEALQNDSIEFHIFGSIEERYMPILRRHPNVILHGAYSPETVPIAAKECNTSLHVSICPETYSLTLSESWELGLVPIVSDIGALGERVSHGINGFKIPPNSTDALIVMLRDLVSNPSKLSAINKQILADLPIAFLPEHIRQLLLIYKSVINNHHLLPSSYLSHEEPPQKIQSNNRINIEWASFDQRSHSDQSRFRATYNYFINQFRAYLSK